MGVKVLEIKRRYDAKLVLFEKSRDKIFTSKQYKCEALFFTILPECSAQIVKCSLTEL